MTKLKKGDIIIIFIFIIAVILLVWLYSGIEHIDNPKAIIKVDGKLYKEIILNNDEQEQEYISFENNKYMKLIYDKSGIYVEDVTCPDKICKKQGKINKSNQRITCLPNKTIIYIENTNNNIEIDGVS